MTSRPTQDFFKQNLTSSQGLIDKAIWSYRLFQAKFDKFFFRAEFDKFTSSICLIDFFKQNLTSSQGLIDFLKHFEKGFA